MTKGKTAMSAIQLLATLGFSLLFFAMSQQANAQQKFEFKFNLKDVLPTGNHEAAPTQPTNNNELITENRPESPAADVQSWISKFKSCTAEIMAMQIDGSQPFPDNNCASALEREFLESGLADSKISCLHQADSASNAMKNGRSWRPDMQWIMRGSRSKPPKSCNSDMSCRAGDIRCQMNNIRNKGCRGDQAVYQCHQNWPYRSLDASWSEMYRAQGGVSEAMNRANSDHAFRQAYAQLINEEKAALAQWQSKSIRPGPASLCEKGRCDIHADVIQIKGDKVLIEIEGCAQVGEHTIKTEYYSKQDGSYVGSKNEVVSDCVSYAKYQEWVGRSSIRPLGWKYDNSHHTIACQDRWDWGQEKNRACWKAIKDHNMKLLK